MVDRLKIKFLETTFANPLILPSGIIQDIPAHKRAATAGAGGVVTKSITVSPRDGNPPPRVVKYKYGYLNSVGLRNPGLRQALPKLKKLLAEIEIPVFVSIFATNIAEFKQLAQSVAALHPQFIELNLSCPNTTHDLGHPLGMWAEATEEVVAAVRQEVGKGVRLIAKLTPNVPNIAEIAKAAETAGADAIAAINTVGPGMVIDRATRKPVLGSKFGGVSGPGIKPIAIRCIYEIYEAVQIPIIGMGGVMDWQDVVEMMLAGATLVGVGSAVFMQGYSVYQKIQAGLIQFMADENLQSLTELIGAAHH